MLAALELGGDAMTAPPVIDVRITKQATGSPWCYLAMLKGATVGVSQEPFYHPGRALASALDDIKAALGSNGGVQ
jgi:hypothetical protein